MESTGWLKGLASGAMGLVFGIAMEKARVTEPLVIQEQMSMSRFIMVKMFLSAVVAGQVGLVCLSHLFPKAFAAARQEYSGCVRRRTFLDSALGAALLGAGMTLSGACPGMVIIQAGAGVKTAIYTLAGLFAAPFAFDAIFPVFERLHVPEEEARKRSVFLDKLMSFSYTTICVSLSLMMMAIIFLLETLLPWTSELTYTNAADASGLSMYAWSPIICGIFVGSLQIPAVLIMNDTLGSSTCYMTVASQLSALCGVTGTHLCSFKSGWANWWQVIYIGSAFFGALISSQASAAATPTDIEGVSPMSAFVGGFIMLLGSRIAGGCTSGHGLSGMGLLAINSFVAVPAMFAGGIATAFALKAF